jgi:hypothetical protein
MTRDNLHKRNLNKPLDCAFCEEYESIKHLFFVCVVANKIWETVSDFFSLPLGSDYISVARF